MRVCARAKGGRGVDGGMAPARAPFADRRAEAPPAQPTGSPPRADMVSVWNRVIQRDYCRKV